MLVRCTVMARPRNDQGKEEARRGPERPAETPPKPAKPGEESKARDPKSKKRLRRPVDSEANT
jgi:hypothetical protein